MHKNKAMAFIVMMICLILAIVFSLNSFTGYAVSEGSVSVINPIGLIFFLSGICAAFYLLKSK